MERARIEEAFRTAILLKQAAHTSHWVEISDIGEVYICQDYIVIRDSEGKMWKITEENLEEKMEQLFAESQEEIIKSRLQEMVFS